MVSTTRRSAGSGPSTSPNAPPAALPEPGQLDLGDVNLAKVIELLQSVQGDAILRESQAAGQPTQTRPSDTETQTVSLFVAEEQEILNRNYPYQAAWTQVTHHPRREPS